MDIMEKVNKKNPKISIITVCLDSKSYIEGAIKSVLEQTYPDIEYIIVDGGSADRSIEIFNKYQNRIDRLVIEKDSGIFDAMNKGIDIARGEFIYFLNSDDKFCDGHVVEKAIGAFSDNKKADFIYGNVVVLDPVSNMSYIERYPRKISKWLFIVKTIGHAATFFRSSCFKKTGLFDLRYKIAADYEWYLRAIFDKGLKGVHVEDNISIFRLGGASTDERNAGMYLLERNLIQKRYFNTLEILYARLLSSAKRLLGKRVNRFLHRLKLNYLKRIQKRNA